eukprot:1462308-Lingulodinium_polyedra.AAC.1
MQHWQHIVKRASTSSASQQDVATRAALGARAFGARQRSQQDVPWSRRGAMVEHATGDGRKHHYGRKAW